MKNETMYFNDLLSIWLEKQKQARALSTYVKYRHLADRYISPYFRAIQLSEVDLPMLQTFRNSLLSPDSLHPLGNGTIRCILLLVNSILRLSYETGQTNGILYLPPPSSKKAPGSTCFYPSGTGTARTLSNCPYRNLRSRHLSGALYRAAGWRTLRPALRKIFIFPIAISMSDTRCSA
ncbi:MAG: N-terminal phage integrase SAM-like domain-containing protein [Clostridium fessum]